jgi:hypothetical protein
MDINTKNLLISENDISKRFELLYKYVENVLKA